MRPPSSSSGTPTVDLAWASEHFSPVDPRLGGQGPLLGDGLWKAAHLLLEHCPMAHSERAWVGNPEGGWVVNRYDDVMAVIQDTSAFSNRYRKGARDDEPLMIPLDVDPPELLEYRRLLQPYLMIRSVARFEGLARDIISGLVDPFLASGHIPDVVTQIARPFSSRVQWGWLVGIDEVDQAQVLDWILTWIHKHFEPEFDEANRAWISWIDATIQRRRTGPRSNDLIDALINGRINGRPLTKDEIRGVMMIMILGGVTSTADAVSNILFRLAVYPELQNRLRADPSLVPCAVEEFLRIEPPVTGLSRRCTRDTSVGGTEVKAGEHVFYHISAANRHPRQFDHPDDVDLERARNRHLSFGAGYHRCLGSNFARQNLRVVLEEILGRMHDIRVGSGDPPRRTAGIAWGMAYLPLAFTPADGRA